MWQIHGRVLRQEEGASCRRRGAAGAETAGLQVARGAVADGAIAARAAGLLCPSRLGQRSWGVSTSRRTCRSPAAAT